MAEVIDVVRGVSPFSKLDDSELAQVVGGLEMVTYSDGDTVFNEGDQSDAMFVIVDGAISVLKNDEPIAELPTGTVLGEIGLLTAHHERTASAKAIGHTVMMRWESADFHRRLEADDAIVHKVALDLACELAERLKRMTNEFMRIQSELRENAPKKVASEFEDFKNRMLNEVFF